MAVKNTITLVIRRRDETVSYKAEEILRLMRDDNTLAGFDGELIRINAPRQVIDLLQHGPGGQAVDDSGEVNATVLSPTIPLILLALSAMVGAAYGIGYQDGYEAGQAAAADEGSEGGEGADSDEDSDEGGGRRGQSTRHSRGAKRRVA